MCSLSYQRIAERELEAGGLCVVDFPSMTRFVAT
jgi:hypothetical protein